MSPRKSKKEEKPKKERGYVKYDKRFAGILVQKAEEDDTFYGTILEVVKTLGCGKATLYVWKAEHPEFAEAMEYALQLGLDKMENDALLRASGRSKTLVKKVVSKADGTTVTEITETTNPPDTKALIFYLTNKRPEVWKEKVDVKHNGNISVVFESSDESLL